MLNAKDQRSEVATLLARITQEYASAKQGMSGLAEGTARHTFIMHHYETIGQVHQQLTEIVGPDAAIAMIADQIERSPL